MVGELPTGQSLKPNDNMKIIRNATPYIFRPVTLMDMRCDICGDPSAGSMTHGHFRDLPDHIGDAFFVHHCDDHTRDEVNVAIEKIREPRFGGVWISCCWSLNFHRGTERILR